MSAQSPCDKVGEEGRLLLKKATPAELDALCHCGAASLALVKPSGMSLPECFRQMNELRSLTIEKAQYIRFPEVLLELEGLEHLTMAFAPIATLPEEMWRMSALKSLNLRGTNINFLPDGLDFVETIDLRFIDFTKAEQDAIRAQYPQSAIYFSAPCRCF